MHRLLLLLHELLLLPLGGGRGLAELDAGLLAQLQGRLILHSVPGRGGRHQAALRDAGIRSQQLWRPRRRAAGPAAAAKQAVVTAGGGGARLLGGARRRRRRGLVVAVAGQLRLAVQLGDVDAAGQGSGAG